jgi:hypothetical protein
MMQIHERLLVYDTAERSCLAALCGSRRSYLASLMDKLVVG